MNDNFLAGETLLDPGLRLRCVTWSDAEAISKMIYDACAADGDAILAVSPDELRHEWQDPQFDIEKDAFVVETTGGHVVGYAELTSSYGHSILNMDGNAHPDYKGRGIGTTLLRAVEKRAREMADLAAPGARVSIRTTINRNAPDGINLHENEGYRPIQYHWRMEIVLNEPPEKPTLPEGIEIRPFIKGEHDIAVWQAQNEAFGGGGDSHDWTLEEWRRIRFEDPEFDPSLWAIAWDGEEVAGFSVNRYRMGIGWIRMLGVRLPWRKGGIGTALLLHSFGEYYRRGMRSIGLGVNANNPTGATRLYQKVGMHPASEHVTYEKEIRSGHELEGQE